MTLRIARGKALLACGLAVATTQVLAQVPAARGEARNQFDIGAWVVRHTNTLRAEPLLRVGGAAPDNLSLENDLGLQRRNTAFTLGYTRLIGQAWHFNAEYTRSSRNSSIATARPLQIGDTSYSAGTALQSDASFTHNSFAAGLALVQREDTEFGVRAGGVAVRTRLRINDSARNLPFDGIVSDVLPMLGLFVHTQHGENWRFFARVDVAAQAGARSTHLQLALRWQPTRNLGLNAGLRVLNGRSSKDDFDIYLTGSEYATYRLSGPQLSASLAF